MNGTGFKAQEQRADSAAPAVSPSGGKLGVSPWMLTWRTSVAFAIALLIGLIPISLYVFFEMPLPFAVTTVYSVRHIPADDAALLAWAKSKPEFSNFQIERSHGGVVIRYEYQGMGLVRGVVSRPDLTEQLQTQLRALGYQMGVRSINTGTVVDFFRLALKLLLPSALVGMVFVAIWNIRRLAKQGRALPPLLAASWGRAVLWGAGVGAALLALGFLHDAVLRLALGHPIPSFWNASESLGGPGKLWLLLLGAIGAPISEELFFRGYMFGSFKREGYIGFGLVMSALIFALLHVDTYHLGVIFIFGLALAWSYHRSSSLVTPMVAHLINNATAFILLFSGPKSG